MALGAISWVGLGILVWHLTDQDPPPKALYGLEYLGLDAAFIFFFVLTFGAWRLVKVASRRRSAMAPTVDVPLTSDALGRRVDAEGDVLGGQILHVSFDDSVKRYRSVDDV